MKRINVFYLTLAALLMAVGHVVQKAVIEQGVDRTLFAFLRIATGFLILLALILPRGKKPVRLLRKNARHFLVLGVLYSGCGILLKLWGLKHTTATNASFLMSLSSVHAILFGALVLGEKARRKFHVIAAAMILGIYLVSTGGTRLIPRKGDLIIFFLSMLIGGMQVYGKTVLARLSALEVAFGRSLFGAVFLGLLVVLFAPRGFTTIDSLPLLLLVLSNGFLFSFAILFFYRALRREAASNSGMFALLTPVFTTLLGYLILREVLNPFQIIGAGIILGGSYLISRQKITRGKPYSPSP